MPSPILARADALMHRKRESDNEFDDLPVLTDAIDEDDIPVLLDAETTATSENPAIEEPELAAPSETIDEPEREAPETELTPPVRMIDPALRDQLIRELAHRVEQRLNAELPGIIEATVRDFLAEQAMIDALPSHN
ncbi:MAG: hypothetical protein H6R13_3907 [Proteobacteria bacterium]|nr:hypothetical protein [Pseudomonadota bacterium]